MSLTPQEIAAVHALRDKNTSRRAEFMALANEVCDMLGIPFAKITGVTRGNREVCDARDLICKLAHDRGFHPAVIAQYIRRDRTSVSHAIGRAGNG
jgi:hypothetical protein